MFGEDGFHQRSEIARLGGENTSDDARSVVAGDERRDGFAIMERAGFSEPGKKVFGHSGVFVKVALHGLREERWDQVVVRPLRAFVAQ